MRRIVLVSTATARVVHVRDPHDPRPSWAVGVPESALWEATTDEPRRYGDRIPYLGPGEVPGGGPSPVPVSPAGVARDPGLLDPDECAACAVLDVAARLGIAQPGLLLADRLTFERARRGRHVEEKRAEACPPTLVVGARDCRACGGMGRIAVEDRDSDGVERDHGDPSTEDAPPPAWSPVDPDDDRELPAISRKDVS